MSQGGHQKMFMQAELLMEGLWSCNPRTVTKQLLLDARQCCCLLSACRIPGGPLNHCLKHHFATVGCTEASAGSGRGTFQLWWGWSLCAVKQDGGTDRGVQVLSTDQTVPGQLFDFWQFL